MYKTDKLKRYTYPLFSFLLILVCLTATASADNNILRTRLKNGLRVVIVQDPLAPVVTTHMTYLVGSNEAPKGFPGMAHALEHMMFRGSKGLSAEQLAAITAAMGGMSNASTAQTITQYYFIVPEDLAELPLRIEAIRMKNVLCAQKLWEKERGAIEQEVARDLSSPMYVFYGRLLKKMFAGTPYAHDALGTRPSFEKTTGSMLKKFHDTWYVPNNALLVIAGDINPEATLPLIKSFFGSIPARPLPARSAIHIKPLKPSLIKLDSNLPYGLAIVACRLPGYQDRDFAAGVIMADVMNSKRGNLYKLVVDGKALFTGFDSSLFKETGMGFAYAGFPRGMDGSRVVNLLKKVINTYKDKGFPKELVEVAKHREITEAEFRKNSISGLASEWSRAIAIEGRNSPDDDIRAIKQVTQAEVNRTARRYFKTFVVGLLIPKTSGKPVFSRGYKAKESFTEKNPPQVELPAWAKKALSGLPVPKSRLNPVVSILPNGLKLIVQRETISPTVTLYGEIKNNPGMQEPKGKDGITDVLDDLFQYGTCDMNRQQFQKAVDDIAANLSAGTSFSVSVLTKHFDRGVELLAQNLLKPRLPEKAFKIVKKETMDALRGKLKSPSYLARHGLLSMLYPKGDPYLRQATPDTVRSITIDDVRRFHKKIFRPDLTSIVIMGDITPEDAKATIEKYFGTWKASGPKPKIIPPPVPPNKKATLFVPDRTRIQNRVILAETIGATRTHRDYYPLQVGLHVLSGGFYATRLYRDLRKKTGLVYTVQAFLDAKKTRSVFGIIYGCDPPNVPKARALVIKDISDMQNTPVTQHEIRQAKTMMIRQVPISEASIDSSSSILLDLATHDLPIDEHVRAAMKYRKTTAKEIQAAFSRWIRPKDFVMVVRGPKPQ
ncbi:MAG: insulinase family protein [Deltaproteobacteria bacterium]|nr:insulinase family protein [Deltaproteobacteria bacterium]